MMSPKINNRTSKNNLFEPKNRKIRIDTSFGLQIAVWKMTIPEIALANDVSVLSLEYRIHHDEIIKPPPRYWSKIKLGLSHDEALDEIGWTKPMIKKVNAILLNARKHMK